MDELERVAQFLFELRRDNRTIDDLPEDLKPTELQTAYLIQDKLVDALLAEYGGKRIGYKIGCTSKGAQELLSTDGPVYGQMLSKAHFNSPKNLKVADYSMIVIECEFGFQMAQDVPAGHYDKASIQPFIKSVMPSIEIVHHRLADWTKFNAPITAADNAIHACWVMGEVTENWQAFDYPNHTVDLLVDGELESQGRGDKVLGSPLNVLAWLANTLPEYGHTLKANDYVTTGVCMDVYSARVSQEIIADFGSLGRVEVTLS